MEQGRFNTDATALAERIRAHDKYGAADLNGWIFAHLDLAEGQNVLELGCGTGKQTLPIAQRVGASGHVTAIDLSQAALDTLAESAVGQGLSGRMTLMRCNLDDLQGRLADGAFERAVSSYALYYAQDPAQVMKTVSHALQPGAVFFFCGPAQANNLEIRQFHFGLKGEQAPRQQGAPVFMEETAPALAHELFSRVEIFSFDNSLRFDSAEALYSYWSSYNLYEEQLDAAFRSAAVRHFATQPIFETIKRVIGVRAVK